MEDFTTGGRGGGGLNFCISWQLLFIYSSFLGQVKSALNICYAFYKFFPQEVNEVIKDADESEPVSLWRTSSATSFKDEPTPPPLLYSVQVNLKVIFSTYSLEVRHVIVEAVIIICITFRFYNKHFVVGIFLCFLVSSYHKTFFLCEVFDVLPSIPEAFIVLFVFF